jgi:hypothetical protein
VPGVPGVTGAAGITDALAVEDEDVPAAFVAVALNV